jgi:hypothetical protein
MVRVGFVTKKWLWGRLFYPTNIPLVRASALTRHLEKFTLVNSKEMQSYNKFMKKIIIFS